MNKLHLLKVADITPLTPKAVKITFAIAENLKRTFLFEAGQYLTLQQTIDNQKVRRAYSICSGTNENELSVAIKAIPNGIFSSYATSVLKQGDLLEVFPAKGSFIFFPEICTADLLLFSAGSGVTPMMSIAKTALSKTDVKVVFAFGNKSATDAMFLKELQELENQYPNRFFLHLAFSQEPFENHFFGRINSEFIDTIFEKHSDLNFGSYYICGPKEMVSDLSTDLLLRGISIDTIFTELFTPAVQKEDFSTLEGSVAITAIFEGKRYVFDAPRNQPLLTSVLKNEIDAPYSCLNGVCSSCIAKVTQGQVKMAKNETLTPAEMEKGFVLSCQSYAMTDSVTLNFDV